MGRAKTDVDHTHISTAYPGQVKVRRRKPVADIDDNGATEVVFASLVESVEFSKVREGLSSGSVQQLLVPGDQRENCSLSLSLSLSAYNVSSIHWYASTNTTQ